MKQLKINREKCVACGLCTVYKEYIDVDEQGYAVTRNSGILQDEDIIKTKEIADVCPEMAITIVDYKSEKNISTAGDLMLFMKNHFEKYELPRITSEVIEFPFIRNGNYSFIMSELQDSSVGKIYTSERRAESAGMQDVSNNVNNVVRNVVRSFLSDYKTGVLNKFRVYEEEPGNYYYDCITEAESMLRQCAIECKNIFGIELPSDILKIKSTAVWRVDSNKKRCALDYLEDRLIDVAMDNVEDASWYDSWVDADGDEKIWTVSVYGANQKISEHAWDGFKEACKYGNVYPVIEQTIEEFGEHIKKEMGQKYHEIIEYLRNNTNFEEALNAEGDWESKARKKVMQQIEKAGDLTLLRRIISVPELAKENAKRPDSTTGYILELDVRSLDGKKVSAGEVIANIKQGTHWHNFARNTGRPQPYGFGVPVDLKRTYEVIAETDGIVHIFNETIDTTECSIGVIAHPKDNNRDELCKWFLKNKL